MTLLDYDTDNPGDWAEVDAAWTAAERAELAAELALEAEFEAEFGHVADDDEYDLDGEADPADLWELLGY